MLRAVDKKRRPKSLKNVLCGSSGAKIDQCLYNVHIPDPRRHPLRRASADVPADRRLRNVSPAPHFFLSPVSSSARLSGSGAYLPNSMEKLALPLDMPLRSPMYWNISDSGTKAVTSLTFPRSPMLSMAPRRESH